MRSMGRHHDVAAQIDVELVLTVVLPAWQRWLACASGSADGAVSIDRLRGLHMSAFNTELALPKNLRDVVEEYDQKQSAAGDAVKAFAAAGYALKPQPR